MFQAIRNIIILLIKLNLYSSYAECCVDDVNASHLNSNDLIIHFGRFCLSTSSHTVMLQRKPEEEKKEIKYKEILYVLPKSESKEINNIWVKSITELRGLKGDDSTSYYIFLDLEYQIYEKELSELMKNEGFSRISISQINTERFRLIPNLDFNLQEKETFSVLGRTFAKIEEEKEEDRKIFVYIGQSTEKFLSSSLSLNIGNSYELYSINPIDVIKWEQYSPV